MTRMLPPGRARDEAAAIAAEAVDLDPARRLALGAAAGDPVAALLAQDDLARLDPEACSVAAIDALAAGLAGALEADRALAGAEQDADVAAVAAELGVRVVVVEDLPVVAAVLGEAEGPVLREPDAVAEAVALDLPRGIGRRRRQQRHGREARQRCSPDRGHRPVPRCCNRRRESMVAAKRDSMEAR